MKGFEGTLTVMKLIEDGVQRVGPPITIHHEPVAEPAAPEGAISGPEAVVEGIQMPVPSAQPPAEG
jgi:hypothetical protein